MGVEADMNKSLGKILLWTPRMMGILFALFLSIFSFDVFDMGLGFWETMLALLIHSMPSILLAVGIALAWKWEWVGALAFLGWAVWYLAAARGFHWTVYALIAGIPALIGTLFLAGWIWRKQIRQAA